jgi:hypothetical protein
MGAPRVSVVGHATTAGIDGVLSRMGRGDDARGLWMQTRASGPLLLTERHGRADITAHDAGPRSAGRFDSVAPG